MQSLANVFFLFGHMRMSAEFSDQSEKLEVRLLIILLGVFHAPLSLHNAVVNCYSRVFRSAIYVFIYSTMNIVCT